MSGWEHVYAVVRRIPRGKVASYGQVAAEAGLGRRNARQVGYALHALGERDGSAAGVLARAGTGREREARTVGPGAGEPLGGSVPWHRVVNRFGEVSHGCEPDHQRVKLLEEGVTFDEKGRVPRERFVAWE